MSEATIQLGGEQLVVRGSGFGDGGKLALEVAEVAANGDSRTALYRPTVAHAFKDEREPSGWCDECGQPEERHTYAMGDIDYTETLTFDTGTVGVRLCDGDEVVAEEVFHLG